MKGIATALALALVFACTAHQVVAPKTPGIQKIALLDDSKVRI